MSQQLGIYKHFAAQLEVRKKPNLFFEADTLVQVRIHMVAFSQIPRGEKREQKEERNHNYSRII